MGDCVRLLKHPQQPRGRVVDINHFTDWVVVKWDDELIPSSQEYPKSAFFDGTFEILPYESPGIFKEKKCECGAKFDEEFPNNHSFWCDLYKKG